MKAGCHVKITKVCAATNAKVPTADWKDYVAGSNNPNPLLSLPADYTVKGYLIEDIRQDRRVNIDRYERNGVKAAGLMSTSPVKYIRGTTFETDNSIYIVEPLD